MKVELFVSMPIYLHGLADLLCRQGIEVVDAKLFADEVVVSDADLFVANVDALRGRSVADFVASARSAPVVLMVEELDSRSWQDYEQAGVHAVTSLATSIEDMVDIIRTTVRGGELKCRTKAGVSAGVVETSNELLSQREGQVLNQIALGRTHSQIANSLGISRHTVDTYVKRIRSKLALGNKAELTRAALAGR